MIKCLFGLKFPATKRPFYGRKMCLNSKRRCLVYLFILQQQIEVNKRPFTERRSWVTSHYTEQLKLLKGHFENNIIFSNYIMSILVIISSKVILLYLI